jgi:hypothetical protein
MSAVSAYFIAHDAHRPDSPAAEASHSRRSSLNPFHKRNSVASASPNEPEAKPQQEQGQEQQQERRRSSLGKIAHKVKKEIHANQSAWEAFYGSGTGL